MPNFIRSLGCLLVFVTLPATAQMVIYKSVGKFGEVRYTQNQPDAQFQTLFVHLPTAPTSKKPLTNHNCLHLQNNLATLNAGGIIHEIDALGNKTLLNDAQVTEKKQQLQQIFNQQCRG